MSAAVMSPLGTMSSNRDYEEEQEAEEERALLSPIVLEAKPEPMEDDGSLSVPSLSDDFFADFEMEQEDEGKDSTPSFGGLKNLGNTCYFNSALQMLASLDRFGEVLEATPPMDQELRSEFLSVMQRLRNGETVNPEAFKRAVDARSSLFIGYRQQDSHEFLTTLLDLLDADYKKKPAEKDESMDSAEEEQGKEPATDNDNEASDEPAEALAIESTETVSALDLPESEDVPPSRSLTELQVEDISQLLHGQRPVVASAEPNTDTAMLPQCKLIGGRAIVPMSGVSQLSSVETEEGATSAPVPDSSAESETPQAQEEQDPSPIEEYFTTEVRARLSCDSCKYTRSHVEKYLHLSLDIGSDSGSVEEGLRKFFAPEHRQIKCEKCFCETATQTMEITKLPRAMLFHCKRFIVDVSPDYSSITYRKNQSPFQFSDALSASQDGILGEFLATDVDIPEQQDSRWNGLHEDAMDDDELAYRIRSVVNHIGSSASCGHYTADGNRMYSNGERRWTRFNDSIVSEVSAEEAMRGSAQRTAYMVMYELE